MIENHDWQFGQPPLQGRQETAVAGENAVTGINQDRIEKAELKDARSDLRDLFFGVCPVIFRVWNQPLRRPHFDSARHRWRDCWSRDHSLGNHPVVDHLNVSLSVENCGKRAASLFYQRVRAHSSNRVLDLCGRRLANLLIPSRSFPLSLFVGAGGKLRA